MNTVQNGKGSKPRNNWGKNWDARWDAIDWRRDKAGASRAALPIKPSKAMALIKGKIRFGPGFGINLSENGVSPYFNTPAGPVDAGRLCVPTTVKGMRFSIGGKNPANMLINAIHKMGRLAKPASPKKPGTVKPLGTQKDL